MSRRDRYTDKAHMFRPSVYYQHVCNQGRNSGVKQESNQKGSMTYIAVITQMSHKRIPIRNRS